MHAMRATWRQKLQSPTREALAAITAEEVTSATQLYEKHTRAIPIRSTGWNNRLALLHRARLAQRAKRGRQWLYRPGQR